MFAGLYVTENEPVLLPTEPFLTFQSVGTHFDPYRTLQCCAL